MLRLRSLAVMALLLLCGCGGAGQYPLTRATVGADDPVLVLMLPILPDF